MASVIFIPDAFSCFILAVQLVPWECYQASGMKNMSAAGNFLLLSATFSMNVSYYGDHYTGVGNNGKQNLNHS